MKTKPFLVGIFLIAGLVPALAAEFGDFTYGSDGVAVAITGYSGPGGAVTIPDTIEGLPVTSIGNEVFASCSSLTSITVPDSVTSIERAAFAFCTGLTSVTIGDNVSSIGEAAFHECTGLTSIIIPDSVTSIGDYAFSNCTSLTTVLIPDSVTRIGGFAFAGCTSLSSIRIPSSVNEWGRVEILFTMGIVLMSSPFSGCITLTSVMVDDGVQAIPDRAFLGCTGLTSVTIPDSVTSIGDWAFSGTGLTSVTIPDSVTSIGDRAFSGCTGLTSITIPNSVTSIGDYAFNSCAGLTSVTIPDSVTSIGGEAFNGCTRLASVYFRGDSPEGPEAFYDCPTTIYYLPGTTGWGATFSDRPTARWVLPNPVILGFGPSFGVRTNQFGFIISWAMNDIPVAVEACSDSTQSSWAPVGSVTLNNGSAYFSDADWANHPVRFYRVRSD